MVIYKIKIDPILLTLPNLLTPSNYNNLFNLNFIVPYGLCCSSQPTTIKFYYITSPQTSTNQYFNCTYSTGFF
jgi:hypothetical protein